MTPLDSPSSGRPPDEVVGFPERMAVILSRRESMLPTRLTLAPSRQGMLSHGKACNRLSSNCFVIHAKGVQNINSHAIEVDLVVCIALAVDLQHVDDEVQQVR